MYKIKEALLTLDDIKSAEHVVRESQLRVRRTPCIRVRGEGGACSLFNESEAFSRDGWSQIWLKCENLQNTVSNAGL